MKELLRRLKLNSEKGQSLVELAITAPILVFMLLGVFEVGWALRGYLVLTNVNREITRFAIREGYLDYSVKDNDLFTSVATVGYDGVLSYTYTTLSDQLPLNFSSDQTSTLIISHIVADTGLACKPGQNCDCTQFVSDPNYYLNGTNVLTYDDLILHPGLPGYEYFYSATFPTTLPVSSTYRTRLNYPELAAELARQNNKFNCELLKKSSGTIPAANNVIITEMHYRQPQLFGFPIIANPYTDPVPMYAHTTMRMIVASRTGDNVDNVGPTCDAYPFTLSQTVVNATALNSTFDILGGPGGSDFGWLRWNSVSSSANSSSYLINELQYPRMALNDFYNAADPTDRNLSIGDRVASLQGINSTVESPSPGYLSGLVGKQIRIPVYSNFSGSSYLISSFVWVRIESAATGFNYGPPDWTSSKNIFATYLGDASADCPEATTPPPPQCPTGYLIWGNSSSIPETIDWSGSNITLSGKVHSNNDVDLSGSNNSIAEFEHVSGFHNGGGGNTYPTLTDLPAPTAPPIAYTVANYAPGSAKALAAGANYHYVPGDLNVSSPGALNGLYYVTGNVNLSGSNLSGNVTIVAQGNIDVSGSSNNLTPYVDKLLFLSGSPSSSPPAIKIAGSNHTLQGVIYALGGFIELSGSNITYQSSIIGDTVRLNGSNLTFNDYNYCP